MSVGVSLKIQTNLTSAKTLKFEVLLHVVLKVEELLEIL